MVTRTVTDRFVANGLEEHALDVIEQFARNTVEDQDIAYLAERLGKSGSVLNTAQDKDISDIASTGGPGSLTTLLCPLLLNSFGAPVVSLGVPGRPAGAVDVLAQIPGYKIELSEDEVGGVLRDCGYAHVRANKHIAPRDALLFRIRKQVGAVSVYPLVIASLLSKKVASGVKNVGLDVRVSRFGNFGTTIAEARTNARRFCRVARLLGIEAVCFLTDASIPCQPFIGRGEALLALLTILENRIQSELEAHLEMCNSFAESVHSRLGPIRKSRKSLRSAFERNLTAQGSSFLAFKRRADLVERSHGNLVLEADRNGFLSIDLQAIRRVLVDLQIAFSDTELFPDPAGVVLLSGPSDFVEIGTPVVSIRAPKNISEATTRVIRDTISLKPMPESREPMEVVTNG